MWRDVHPALQKMFLKEITDSAFNFNSATFDLITENVS